MPEYWGGLPPWTHHYYLNPIVKWLSAHLCIRGCAAYWLCRDSTWELHAAAGPGLTESYILGEECYSVDDDDDDISRRCLILFQHQWDHCLSIRNGKARTRLSVLFHLPCLLLCNPFSLKFSGSRKVDKMHIAHPLLPLCTECLNSNLNYSQWSSQHLMQDEESSIFSWSAQPEMYPRNCGVLLHVWNLVCLPTIAPPSPSSLIRSSSSSSENNFSTQNKGRVASHSNAVPLDSLIEFLPAAAQVYS